MAYQKKYYFTFKQLGTDDDHLVEIWQDTVDTLTAEEVKGMASPFIVEMNELDHKFQPVIGHGCEVGMLSTTDRKFLDGLYHVDPKEFIVKHYINSSLNYLGYLNSEMYSESYSDEYNYGTSITGNDGLALADRYTFLQSDESKYTGLKTEFDILNICLASIGLDWTEIRIALATTFADFSGDADSTILHETYVDCANFYDEDDYPMTMREVMESILQPYGAQLFIVGGNIYIVDIQSRTEGIDTDFASDVSFQRFTYSTGAYVADIDITINKSIQSIGHSGTGQSIELSGGVNKQVVSYSPYPLTSIIENQLTSEDEFTTVPASFSTKDDYYYKTLSGHDVITPAGFATFEESYGGGSSNDVNLYLRWQVISGSYYKVADIVTPNSLVISGADFGTVGTRQGFTDGLILSISFKMLAKTRANPYDETQASTSIDSIKLKFKIKIGDKYYNFSRGGDNWTDTDDFVTIALHGDFNDKFVDADDGSSMTNGIDVYLGNAVTDLVLNGSLSIELYSDISVRKKSTWEYEDDPSYIDEIWISDLSANLVTVTGSEIPDTDKEYIGELNKLYADSGQTIQLTTGSNYQYSDRAKLLSFDGTDYAPIYDWTRASQTFRIEELLLNSVVSNYRAGFIKINNLKLRQLFSSLNVITDTNIADKVFMLKNAKFDYEMNDVECSLWETSPDRLTIVP